MKPEHIVLTRVGLATCALVVSCPVAHADGWTGQYLATFNASTVGKTLPSMNNRLTANDAPAWIKGNVDFRLEQYVENSFHGPNDSQVRERKLEEQANYNHPLTEHLNAVVGLLHHSNSTFRDNYWWGIAGFNWSGQVAPEATLSAAALVERRNGGGRVFYDLSGSIERRFFLTYGAFVAAHLYENLGEYDPAPTHKREFEAGLNYYPNDRYFAGVSYFDHRQGGDPTDRFSMMKLKLGLNF